MRKHGEVYREYFEKIISCKKKLKLRLADFEADEGDTFVLEELDKDKEERDGKLKLLPLIFSKPKAKLFGDRKKLKNTGYKNAA